MKNGRYTPLLMELIFSSHHQIRALFQIWTITLREREYSLESGFMCKLVDITYIIYLFYDNLTVATGERGFES